MRRVKRAVGMASNAVGMVSKQGARLVKPALKRADNVMERKLPRAYIGVLGARAGWYERAAKRSDAKSLEKETRAGWAATARIAPMGGHVELLNERRDNNDVSNLYAKAAELKETAQTQREKAEAFRARQIEVRKKKQTK